jgi:2-polyprenyl-3-methyl-5-hydroxy-6-metoxy-1,4-benzoquinol methylase
MKQFDKYEKYGAYHWNAYKNNPEYRKHVNVIKKFFSTQKTGSLLDVECGDGFISHVLSESGYQVLGIDTDPVAIVLAKSKTGMASFEVNKIENMKEKMDYVLISNVIEYVDDDKVMLTQASRLAKTGTLVTAIITDLEFSPNKNNARKYSDKSFSKLMTDTFENVMIFMVEPTTYAWCVGRKQ